MSSLEFLEGAQPPAQRPTESLLDRITARAFDTYPSKIQAEALRRRAYVDALHAQNRINHTKMDLHALTTRVAERIGDAHPPSVTTLYRWIHRLQQSDGDLRALIPNFGARGGHAPRLADAVLELLESTIQRVYLDRQRRPIRAVHDALLIQIAQANATRPADQQLATPSYATVRRYVRSLPCYEVDQARYGREYARKKFRHSGVTPQVTYLLERTEIDHTPLNLFVIDEETLQVLGRPYVTWMIDCSTRMICGFYVSFGPPSIDAVFRCLKHAIERKDYVRERYPDIVNDWPTYGIPILAVVDNGLEFHAKDLLRATYELGINYQFCPPRTPWFKPMVERSLRALAEQFAHLLPGTSFASWVDRYGYDPLTEGVVTMSELTHALHVWIIDVYAQSYHRGLKMTPYAAWKKGLELASPRSFPTERLSLALSQQQERVLGHAGIELHGLRYNGEDLLVVRKQLGDRIRVQVRFDPDNLGAIMVLHPQTKEPIAVPCLMPDYADGLPLYQHKLIQKAIRHEGMKAADPLALAKAKARMQEIVGQLVRSRKLADRKKAARSRGSNSAEAMKRPTQVMNAPEDWNAPTDMSHTPSVLPTLNTNIDDGEHNHE